MQQGYARGSGVREKVAAQTLVEDALRIHRQALEQEKITLVREFSPAPLLLIDKHKVLEILVNLIGNARYACEAMTRTRPRGGDGETPVRITVRVDTPKGDRAGDRVRIVVADNGVGIPHEKVSRIFDSGITTLQLRGHDRSQELQQDRQQDAADGHHGGDPGHGFGLHNAATTARELGGSLFVHSDGPGKGARFTLDLPVRPPEGAVGLASKLEEAGTP